MNETKPDARPKHLTYDMKMSVAREIASRLLRHGHIDEDPVEQAAKDIARHAHGPYTDGYSIAKSLDDQEGWDCNLDIAEILDGFSGLARDELDRAEAEWAKRTNPQPPFALGTRVRVGNETGVLDEIYKHGTAKYLVKIDGDPRANSEQRSRRIVNFEDVIALAPHQCEGGKE